MSGSTKDGGFVLDDREAEEPVYVLSPDGKTLVRVSRDKSEGRGSAKAGEQIT